jgi:hypothetical protein
MPHDPNVAGLERQIMMFRRSAVLSRDLAEQATDWPAKISMLEHANELERLATDLKARIAFIKQAAFDADAA